ncbi:MAG: sensor histidine kinase [Leucobacter sp.]
MNSHHYGNTPDELALPRPPGVLRRALSAHPRAVDVTIVVVYLFGCLMMGVADAISADVVTSPDEPGNWFGLPVNLMWPLVLLTILRVVVTALALLYRRRFPLIGLIAVVVLLFGDQSFQTFPNSVAMLFLLYAVPVYRGVTQAWIGYGVAVLSTILSGVLDWAGVLPGFTGGGAGVIAAGAEAELMSLTELIGVSVMSSLWYLAIVMIGINLGNRRRYLAAIIDRAHQLARERDQLAQLAVAEERSRIAREMHDIVAHSVSVMIALSDGASRVVETAPEAAADAMERSGETGRTALAEMRRLLGALNEPGEGSAEFVPAPGVSTLPELVEGFRDAGLEAELRVSGGAAGDRGQDLAVYRIVQEGLTNVLRYAGPGARAVVTVERTTDRTTVTVRDYGAVVATGVSDAGPERAPGRGLGSGRGLRGLEERVRVFDGTLEAGPTAGGGWQLAAILPVNASAREPRPATTQSAAPTETESEAQDG